LIRSKGVELEGKLVALEAQPDPGPLFAGFPPTLAVHQILDRIKGYTSYVLGQAFSWLRRQVASLWKRSYYAGTAGEVSAETMRRYIEAQKGSHVQKDR
jgi:putative transposase